MASSGAKVLMLRSVGVPARLAVGFAEGEYKNGTYTVRRRDAHAWPEVFFPGLGWVEFEPTVSQQPLVRTDPAAQANNAIPSRNTIRPLEDDERPGLKPPTTPATRRSVPLDQTLAGRALLAALSVLAVAISLYLLYRYRAITFVPLVLVRAFESSGITTPAWVERWSLWNRLDPVEQAFASINLSLRWLGKPAAIYATPAERAATLKTLLPAATEHIEAVASELETGLFTPHPADVARARRSGLMVLVHTLRARLRYFLGI